MKTLIPLLLLTLQLLSHDPKTVVAGCVDAITGQIVYEEQDLVIDAPEPLILPRSYNKEWEFYPHLRLSLYEKYKKKKVKNRYIKVKDLDGVAHRYKQSEKGAPFIYDVDRESAPSSDGRIRSSFIQIHDNLAVLKLHNGTRRIYVLNSGEVVQTKKHECRSKTFLLVKEELPNGNAIHYIYDQNERLEFVYTASPTGHRYAHIKFTYLQGNIPGDPTFTVETSDGRELAYKYKFKKKQTMEKSYFLLESIEGTHLPKQVFDYEDEGTLKSVISKANRILKYKYKGRVLQLFEPVTALGKLEATYHFHYNPDRPMTEVLDLCGGKTTYYYSEQGRPYKIIRGRREETLTWRSGDLVKRVVRDRRNIALEETFDYDRRHNLIRKTVNGVITEYRYNQYNRCIYQKDPSGGITEWEYLGRTDLPLSKTVNGEARETYLYNEDNILIEKHFKHGSTHTLTRITPYGGDIEPGEIRVGLGRPRAIEEFYIDHLGEEHRLSKNEFFYDRAGHVIKKFVYNNELQLQYALDFAYDIKGNLLAETNPAGHKTLYTYNDFGQCTKEVHEATDLTIKRRYDACGRLKSESENGHTTIFGYDRKHRKTSMTTPLGKTIYAYDEFDNLTKITHPDGSAEEWDYDILGHIVKTRGGQKCDMAYIRNIHGSPLTEETIDERLTTYKYDDAGRLIEKTDPLGRTTHIERDAFGRVVRENETTYRYVGPNLVEENRLGGVTLTYEYDNAGRKTAEYTHTDRGTRTERYEYDSMGRLASRFITSDDSEGHKILFEYDQFGELIKEEPPTPDEIEEDNQLRWIEREYDCHGNITAQIEEGDRITEIIYTKDDQKQVVIKPDDSRLYYSYDEKGRLTSLVSEDGTVDYTYEYDELGYPIKMGALEREYDQLGHLMKETLPSGLTITYTIDLCGRKKALTLPNGETIRYRFDSQHLRQVQYKKWKHSYTYSKEGLLIEETNFLNEKISPTPQLPNKLPIKGRHLTYDALDRPTQIENNSYHHHYAYDALDRRITESIYKEGVLECERYYLYDEQNEIGYVENGEIKELRIPGLNGNTVMIFRDGQPVISHEL